MSDTKQIHFTLNLSKIKDRQIYDYIIASGKGQKAFFMDCVETCMNGGSVDAQGGEVSGGSLILERLQKIEYILTAGYTPPKERPQADALLPGQMEVEDYIEPPTDNEDVELDSAALDALEGWGD